MDHRKGRRKRAVCLTKDAIELLEAHIIEQWTQKGKSTRLTREARAEMLGVSILTADKILNGEGVDRASLIISFKSLSLEWHARYCVSATSSPELAQLPVPKKRRLVTPLRVAIFVCSLALIGAAFPVVYRASIEYGNLWQKDFRTHMDKGWKAFHSGEYGLAGTEIEKSYEMAKVYRQADALAEAVRFRGEVLAAKGSFDKAQLCFQEALTLNQSIGTFQYSSSILETIANNEVKMGQLSEAVKHYQESLEYGKSFRNRNDIASAYRGLGSLRLLQNKPQDAENFFQQSLATLKNDVNPNMVVDVRARLAMVWVQVGRVDEAITVLKNCLQSWKDQKHVRWVATTQLQLSKAYQRQGDREKAKEYLETALKGFQQVGDKNGENECRTSAILNVSEVTRDVR